MFERLAHWTIESSGRSLGSELAGIKLGHTTRTDGRARYGLISGLQWTRSNERNDIDDIGRFDVDRSAYVVKLDYLDDKDKRTEGTALSRHSRTCGVVESWVKSIRDGSYIVSYSDIVNAQMKSYIDKIEWFHETCKTNYSAVRFMVRYC